ncbi:hypothetical protein [Hymenobacter armeniacus]|uniref:Uncharacterized protein n=1 Tax=Hymenobacter armeniacus TaxID=2771358 RepID=A0ABR8JX79_9BACT|nr:hypothetical protein [Hymenobacter armeniacus]MBD2724560.1 hypothetical protein [Hymenobacter armeniacus]
MLQHRILGTSALAGLLTLALSPARAQAVPNPGERVESLITFGAQSDKQWGDDDFSQTFFFLIPEKQRTPVYIRVFDPDCGGKNDDLKGPANTTTSFSLYGGPGTFSGPQARDPRPTSPTPPGRLLKSVTFGQDAKYDGKWYTFGPLNPLEGEMVDEFKGHVFKLVARGMSGNDGNLYRYFFSTSPTENVSVEGGNAFTYEYCFRLPATASKTTVHLYPFVNDKVVSIKQSNFDVDNAASLNVFSIAKNGQPGAMSGDGVWTSSTLPIADKEHGLSLDFRLTSTKPAPNDMVLYVTDQYDTALPFFAIPLGGPPRYQYDVKVKVHR